MHWDVSGYDPESFADELAIRSWIATVGPHLRHKRKLEAQLELYLATYRGLEGGYESFDWRRFFLPGSSLSNRGSAMAQAVRELLQVHGARHRP